jgi:acyl-CoA synthetase (AMP-forming)/AMP-acid ligase II
MNALADICDFQPEDVVLHVAPLSHGSGFYAIPSIARGSENIVYPGDSFDAEDVLAVAERERVTVIAFLAPTMIHMLLDAGPGLTVPSLRRVPYGGAPIDAGLAGAAIERFGRVFAQIYGMGESPMTITYLRPQDHRGRALASAGIPRTDVEVRLVDESGAPVEDGAEGEVCVRGDVVMLGYWQDDEATARALAGGWLHTGDVGRIEDGYLYLVSRTNDVIISGGANIYPREVEDVLHRHPAIREACVFGVPDPKWGESVAAAVVASAPVGADELVEHCRAHIASFKKPTRIEFVDALPKNAYGKVLRRELRERFASPSATTGA